MTVVYPAPAPAPVPPLVIVRPRQTAYLIAFKDSLIGLADAYWVSGNTFNYVTPDHQMKTAPLASVDRTISERLNSEQNVSFSLPLPCRPNRNKLLRRPLERRLNGQRSNEQRLNVRLGTRNTSRGLVRISNVLF